MPVIEVECFCCGEFSGFTPCGTHPRKLPWASDQHHLPFADLRAAVLSAYSPHAPYSNSPPRAQPLSAQPSPSCSVLLPRGFFPLGVSSSRTVPAAATPPATTAASAASFATCLTFPPVIDDLDLLGFALRFGDGNFLDAFFIFCPLELSFVGPPAWEQQLRWEGAPPGLLCCRLPEGKHSPGSVSQNDNTSQHRKRPPQSIFRPANTAPGPKPGVMETLASGLLHLSYLTLPEHVGTSG
jgi:hypothetical protein